MAIIPAPNVGTYATRSLYVSPSEFKAAPTGVDVSQLIPQGNPAQQAAALVMQLQRASAYADNFCQKVLAATVDTQAGFYRVQNHPALGPVLKIPLNYTPIIAVSDIRTGPTPGSMAAMTDLSNIWIDRKTVTVPFGGGSTMGPSFTRASGKQYAAVSYINGWANTSLASAASPGATTITVASTLGIMPGMQINLQNTTNAEVVTISTSWTPSNTGATVAVPINGPVVGTYATGDTVTALPQDIKQAVILIAKALIKTRGSESIVIASTTSQPDHIDKLENGVSSDLDMAMDLLSPHKRGI
ncbi:hypothetical protein [Pseudarthrobacter sp. S9]|uniref:hypothetical protein n=1 Tax=Pseudarthrobacter sp. S9 TaxID=3418421 RepID=UPI003D093B3A